MISGGGVVFSSIGSCCLVWRNTLLRTRQEMTSRKEAHSLLDPSLLLSAVSHNPCHQLCILVSRPSSSLSSIAVSTTCHRHRRIQIPTLTQSSPTTIMQDTQLTYHPRARLSPSSSAQSGGVAPSIEAALDAVCPKQVEAGVSISPFSFQAWLIHHRHLQVPQA
jgi:hypothetical protein